MDKSVWSEVARKEYKSLNGDITCDVLVIGGGMAGVLTAHYLQKLGRKVVLVEARQLGDGITKNTTAVITAQHDTLYKDMIKKNGASKARDYLNANLQAVQEFKTLIENEGIDCELEITPSYLYSYDKMLNDEVKALESLGYSAELVQDIDLPFEIRSAVKFNDMAQFHPLKFLYGLADKFQDVEIYENTFIENIEEHTARYKGGKIEFNQAVVASHFPFINSHGLFFIKMYQCRSYVMAIEDDKSINGSYIDDLEEGFYFRKYNNLLIVGKGEHRTGMKTDALEELKAFKQKFYPDAEVKYLWANQDCVTLDDIPYIGNYGKMQDVYVATGFNLWGMTGSMVSATMLADMMCGRLNKYDKTFCSKRCWFKPKLFANLGMVLINMLYPTTKRCPHLGCALKYNKLEHTWDCSCHGSRFDENGKIIDNPAMHNLD